MFKIIKKGANNFWHYYNNDAKKLYVSKITFNLEEVANTFVLVQANGSNVPANKVLVTDIIVIDETDASVEETFATAEELRVRLNELGYGVVSSGGGGIPDAPNNSNAYVRSALSWVIGYTKTAIDNLLALKQNILVAGDNITIDNTDPLNPIISSTGGGGGVGTLQEVTDEGAETSIPMLVKNEDNSRAIEYRSDGFAILADAGNKAILFEAETPTGTMGTGRAILKDVGDDTEIIAYESDIPSVGDFVPYTGATQNVNLGENGLKAGQIELDTTPTGTAGVAVTRWNDTIGSSETTLKGGNVILKNGVDLVARVVNKVTPNTTLTKASYQVVRISGAQGQRLAVNLAQANNDNNSADTLGIVTETIATNQEGFIMTIGQLENINTTGSLQGETWVDGDVLYLSPTIAGRITNVKPVAPAHIVIVGYVEYAHANNGKIYVKVMNGWELDELHNVAISTPLNNQGLIYETSTDLWKNKTIIEDSITNGVTTIAPSQNAVFDALNLKIDKPQTLRATSNITLTATTSSQKLFGNLGANGDGSFNVEVGTYDIKGLIKLSNLGTGVFGFMTGLGDGISTFSNITIHILGRKKNFTANTVSPIDTIMESFTSNTNISDTSSTTTGVFKLDGVFEVTSAGKFYPGFSLGVAIAAITNSGSYVTIQKTS
jgi:nitrogen fixation protein